MCPNSLSVLIPSGASQVACSWPSPQAEDNVKVDVVSETYQSDSLFSAGIYVVQAWANDTSGNVSPTCNFTLTVTAPASASASVVAPAMGAGGGGAVIVILLLVVLLLRRNRQEAYGQPMSDEEILATAQVCHAFVQHIYWRVTMLRRPFHLGCMQARVA